MPSVDGLSSNIWSSNGGNASHQDQSQVNTRHGFLTRLGPLKSNNPASSVSLLILIY
jgi:hypothetical protein